ncbi:hypothetical protein FIBSPDRAFT_1025938 [Athelia psychrophila]|uniref:Uncharacterized protein n=1 Tax=Athelia psychrophila TaxID=1759441 RepID=A0A166HMS7_9AGAM|nr:hypothetical protein FIBSPDRAFT_1025938 [Fibularhizoctonia sp. CBS 109695]
MPEASSEESDRHHGLPTGNHRSAEGHSLEDGRRGEDASGSAASGERSRAPLPPLIHQPSVQTPTRSDHFPAVHAPSPGGVAGIRNNEGLGYTVGRQNEFGSPTKALLSVSDARQAGVKCEEVPLDAPHTCLLLGPHIALETKWMKNIQQGSAFRKDVNSSKQACLQRTEHVELWGYCHERFIGCGNSDLSKRIATSGGKKSSSVAWCHGG